MTMIAIDRLLRGPHVRRQAVPATDREALRRSIAEVGVLTPILARPAPGITGEEAPIPANAGNHSFEVVNGWQRVEAARAAGVTQVPVEVRPMNDAEVMVAQLADNTLRQTLHPVDGWLAVRDLVAAGYNEARAAEAVGLRERDIKAMGWLAGLHPAILDLCRIAMPELNTLRKIARAPADLQERAAQRGRGADDADPDEDDFEVHGASDPHVDWGAVADGCTVISFSRGLLLDPDSATGIAWQYDWLAEPGEGDEYTTTDAAAFLDAQRAEISRRIWANKNEILVEWNRKAGKWDLPDGYHIDHSVGPNEKLKRGYKKAYMLGVSGRVDVRVLAPNKPDAALADQASDDQVADQAATPETDAAHEAPPPDPVGITGTGMALVAARKDRALLNRLMDGHINQDDLLVAMTLAFCADNVSIHNARGDAADLDRIAARLVGPDGVLRNDLDSAAINACARSALAHVLRLSGHGSFQHIPSGHAAEWVGHFLGADEDIGRFDDNEFLQQCKGDTLRAIAEVAQVKWQGKVGDMRKRLEGQAPDWRPSQAQFGAIGPRS